MNTFASTPEKPLPPLLKHSSSKPNLQLPPLSALLSAVEQTPFKQHVPINLTPLETPRYAAPPFHKNAQVHVVDNSLEKTPRRTQSSMTANVSNTSMDSDADSSMVNDSMIRPATKRKVTSPSRDFAFISHSPATYPSQEPSIDNASLARRKRRRTSPNELAILNQEFLAGSTPEKARRLEIAQKVNMSEKAIQIWFQNKRQSLRRLKSAEKEITLLPPTPDSSAVASATHTDAAPTPLYESTPIRPSIIKSHSQHFTESPAMAQSSPIRSYSTSNLQPIIKDSNKATLLSRILASSNEKKENSELVMNLTNKKQPEFARQSEAASTQLMTFKLTPKDRKPLAALDANSMNRQKTKDNQCIQGLLSLRAANH